MARKPDYRFFVFLLAVAPAAIVGTLYQPSAARSFPAYPPLLPNRAYAIDSSGISAPCITCHNNPDGGQGCVASGGTAPCFNPFGLAFRDGGKVWTSALAGLDSDGDGFTNGAELQDPTGAWFFGSASPGIASYATRPGFSDSTPGTHDMDADGYCWFGRDMNADRDCVDAGEITADFDCDDSKANVHSGATEVCTTVYDDDCNGLDAFHDPVCVAIVDADQDGYCPMGRDLSGDHLCIDANEMTADVDCDDHNLLVRPGAPENCIDGIDNDCNTLSDANDPACTGQSDMDADGYCPIGQDVTDNAGTGGPDGDCLDIGEPALPSDCNDRDANVNPGHAEICGDLQDNNCNLLADFSDAACLPVADKDGDGYCPNGRDNNRDGDCIDTTVTAPAVADVIGPGMGYDCDDAAGTIFSAAVELCSDAIDQDCDGQAGLGDPNCVGYLDQDGDAYCPVGGIDQDGDGSCIDLGEESVYADCSDTSGLVFPGAVEICTNGIDDNCDGISDAHSGVADAACGSYADWDYDGYCATGTDLNVDGDCADLNEQTAVVDDRPYDSTVSPGNHESCFDQRDNDQDGFVDLADPECVATVDADQDGYCPVGKDVNGDGDCTDAGENYGLSDCRDDDAAWGPQVTEVFVESALLQRCFDYDDNDCDGKVDLADTDCEYLFDRDADGICGHGADINADGDCLDLDEQNVGGDDCDDADPARASNNPEVCSNAIDDDCDGKVDLQDPNCQCQLDGECPAAPMCQIARCMAGTCVDIPDPACVDFGSSKHGLCAVQTPTALPSGGGPREGGIIVAMSLAAVVLRRMRRARPARP